MPRDGIKKIGNKKLDAKQDSLDLWEAKNSEDRKLQSEYKAYLKFMKLLEMMQHFKINPRDENAWMYLSIRLAEHYVPAMQFSEKKGQPQKWSFDNKLKLFALVEGLRARFPEMKRKEIFNRLPAIACKTSLKTIISEETKPITLEGYYDKFISSGEGKEIVSILSNYTPDEKMDVFIEIVSNEDYFYQ